MNKKLEEMSEVEMKAMWLDHLINIEQSQKTIQAIQAELQSRNKPVTVEVKAE